MINWLQHLNVRQHNYHIHRLLKNKTVIAIPVYDYRDIPQSIIKLIDYIETTTDDRLTAYCTFHCYFVAIHPLKDNNGTFARSHYGVKWDEVRLRQEYYQQYNNAVLQSVWNSWNTHQVNIRPFKQFMLDHPFLWKFK